MTERHVVPSDEGGWDVVKPDGKRRSAHSDTQKEAIGRAREIVQNVGGGEVVIHDRQGNIRDSKTITPGNDAKPTRHTNNPQDAAPSPQDDAPNPQ